MTLHWSCRLIFVLDGHVTVTEDSEADIFLVELHPDGFAYFPPGQQHKCAVHIPHARSHHPPPPPPPPRAGRPQCSVPVSYQSSPMLLNVLMPARSTKLEKGLVYGIHCSPALVHVRQALNAALTSCWLRLHPHAKSRSPPPPPPPRGVFLFWACSRAARACQATSTCLVDGCSVHVCNHHLARGLWRAQ